MDRKDAFFALFLCGTVATVISIVGVAVVIDSKCPCGDDGLCCFEAVDDSTTTMDCNGGCTCFSESEGAVECRAKTREIPPWATALLVSLGVIGAIGGIGWGVLGVIGKSDSVPLNDNENESKDLKMRDTVIVESYGEWGIMAGGRMGCHLS